ncbi:MAG: B12-binding domain-containing radical SAM protein [Candidatus Helarchaeota archaeon]
MNTHRGKKIVLTASDSEMCDWADNPFMAFFGAFPDMLAPKWVQKWWVNYDPEKTQNTDGTAKVAPYGLRKVEAALIRGGFKEEDVVVVHPNRLDEFVGSDTKLVAISSMDPLGMAYVSMTYTTFLGFGSIPVNRAAFRRLLSKKCFKKYKPKVIVGGSGSWQLNKKAREMLGIDAIVIGEADKDIAKLVDKIVNKNEPFPDVVKCEKRLEMEDIPLIKHASIHGIVEISRGCGRNCQFCAPTMRLRKDMPYDRIIDEVKVNLREGRELITLATEDCLIYGANTHDGKFLPNVHAVCELFRRITAVPGVKYVQPAHLSLAPVASEPEMITELDHILDGYGRFVMRRGNKKYRTLGESGIETGSPRLIAKYMRGKPLPYTPEQWPEMVIEAYGILNDNNFMTLSTFMIGLPAEEDEDVLKSIELVDEMIYGNYMSFLVPNVFINLHDCILRKERKADFNHLSELQMEMFINCWKFNLKNFRERWLAGDSKGRELINHMVVKWLTPSIYALYYRKHHEKFAKFMKDFFLTVGGYKPINVSKQFSLNKLKKAARYLTT